jgi:hypothetical protein
MEFKSIPIYTASTVDTSLDHKQQTFLPPSSRYGRNEAEFSPLKGHCLLTLSHSGTLTNIIPLVHYGLREQILQLMYIITIFKNYFLASLTKTN